MRQVDNESVGKDNEIKPGSGRERVSKNCKSEPAEKTD